MSKGAEKSQAPELRIEPGQDLKANTLKVAVKAGFYRKAVEVCYIPILTTYFPALIRFVPEFTRNHAVIPGHFILSDAQNPSRGPTYWPPNVTGCRKIPTARGGNRTWASRSKGKHSTTSL